MRLRGGAAAARGSTRIASAVSTEPPRRRTQIASAISTKPPRAAVHKSLRRFQQKRHAAVQIVSAISTEAPRRRTQIASAISTEAPRRRKNRFGDFNRSATPPYTNRFGDFNRTATPPYKSLRRFQQNRHAAVQIASAVSTEPPRRRTNRFGDFNRSAGQAAFHGYIQQALPARTAFRSCRQGLFVLLIRLTQEKRCKRTSRSSSRHRGASGCGSVEIADAHWRILLRSASPRDAKLLAAALLLPCKQSLYTQPPSRTFFSARRLKGADAAYFLRRRNGLGYVPPVAQGTLSLKNPILLPPDRMGTLCGA